MPKPIKSITEIKIGDFFEDCAFHPCLCIRVATEDNRDDVEAISLVDGSIRCCSVSHCGLRSLTVDEVIRWKTRGPSDTKLKPKQRWWKIRPARSISS